MIEIKIFNHSELAKKQSFFAKLAQRVASDTLKWRVERVIAEEIRKNLAAQGVEATVYVK